MSLHASALALLAWLITLAPAAIGAAVGLAWEASLCWQRRVEAWLVGISVSWAVTPALDDLLALKPQSRCTAAFAVALIAFKALPPVRDKLVAIAVGLPDLLFPKLKGPNS